MKVSELSGADLDYWVAVAEGETIHEVHNGVVYIKTKHGWAGYMPSTDWLRAGPIIERRLNENRQSRVATH